MFINDLIKSIMQFLIKFFKDETQHPIGKVNLAGGIIAIVPFIIGCPGFLVDKIVSYFTHASIPNWSYALPLIMAVALLAYFYGSLNIIPQRPPRQTDPKSSKGK